MSSDLTVISAHYVHAVFASYDGGERTPACPDAAVWYEMAAGQTPPETEARLVDHAIDCLYCAPLMKTAFDDMRTESVVVPPNPIRMPYRFLCVAAGIIAAICLYRFAWPYVDLYRAHEVLARAEAVDRPSEFRLSGAPYAPVRFNRSGSGQDRLPPDLVAASALAAQAPQSADTEILRARIAIDSRDLSDHAPEIRDAMRRLGNTPRLWNDLGVAQATHGLNMRDDGELRESLKSFERALALPEARFNRALVLDLLGEKAEACKTSDPDRNWQNDLQARLACK